MTVRQEGFTMAIIDSSNASETLNIAIGDVTIGADYHIGSNRFRLFVV